MRPIRILHLRATNFVGGPERQLLRYAEHEREGPIEIVLGTFLGRSEGVEFIELARKRGFQTVALPAGRAGNLSAFCALRRFITEHGISLVCTHGYRADILVTLAALIRPVPVAWFLRGWTGENWKVRGYEALDRMLLPVATRIVSLSQTQARRFAKRRMLAGKVCVVTNAIDVSPISPEERSTARRELRCRLGLPNDCEIVATAGRLSPEKGPAYFVESVPALRRRFAGARFVLFGDGPLRESLKHLTCRLGVSLEVLFPGHLPDLPGLLPGIDVLVNPSLSEEMPNIVLECMAAGVPIVATDVGGVKEMAGESECPAIIAAGDSAAIARAVIGVVADPERAKRMASAGCKRVRDAYAPARQHAQLRDLYRELVPELKVTLQVQPPRFVSAGS